MRSGGNMRPYSKLSTCGGPQPGRLPLAEGAQDLIVQRLGEVGDHGAVVGLHERLDRHSRHQLHVAEPCDLLWAGADAYRVVALPGLLLARDVGRDVSDRAVDLRRGALVEGREAQSGRLAEMQLIDVLRERSLPRSTARRLPARSA